MPQTEKSSVLCQGFFVLFPKSVCTTAAPTLASFIKVGRKGLRDSEEALFPRSYLRWKRQGGFAAVWLTVCMLYSCIQELSRGLCAVLLKAHLHYVTKASDVGSMTAKVRVLVIDRSKIQTGTFEGSFWDVLFYISNCINKYLACQLVKSHSANRTWQCQFVAPALSVVGSSRGIGSHADIPL